VRRSAPITPRTSACSTSAEPERRRRAAARPRAHCRAMTAGWGLPSVGSRGQGPISPLGTDASGRGRPLQLVLARAFDGEPGAGVASSSKGSGYITSKIEMLAPLSFTGQPLAISTASFMDPALISE
jgi:hypothetical protein